MEVKVSVFVLPSTCSSPVLTIFWWPVFTVISQPPLVSHLLFAPDCPERKKEMGARKEWEEQRHTRRRIDAKKTKLTVRESRWIMLVIYHTKSKDKTGTGMPTQSKQKAETVFYLTFLSSSIHLICFIRDVILQKAKTSSSNLGLNCTQH